MGKTRIKKQIIVAVSGGFDPAHVGHIRMFKAAKKLGDKLIVILNCDNWLIKKKGYFLMEERDRKEIIRAIRYVDEVILTGHSPNPEDMSICRELTNIRPHIFANGGDRKADNIPEYELCQKYGIKMVFNVGGGKVRSSSTLVNDASLKSLKN